MREEEIPDPGDNLSGERPQPDVAVSGKLTLVFIVCEDATIGITHSRSLAQRDRKQIPVRRGLHDHL
jgi:hypothetical protein